MTHDDAAGPHAGQQDDGSVWSLMLRGRGRRGDAGAEPPDAPDGAPEPRPDDDLDLAPALDRRAKLVATGLLSLIGLSLAFTGGVLVQKRHDATTTASGSTGLPAGFPAGLQGLPSGVTGPPGGAGPGAAASGSTSAGPVLVGTVVSARGRDITVKDFQGRTYTVRTSGTTTLTIERATTAGGIAPGTTVRVEGDKSGTTVTATTVVARPR